MTDKIKTVVVLEHHEQTTVRRSRRVVGSAEMPLATENGPLAGPLGRAQAKPVLQEKRQSLGACLKEVAMKSAALLHRLKARANKRRNRIS